MTDSSRAARDAYAARADDYIAFTGDISQTDERDQQRIAAWAEGAAGLVIDAGAGPGQWTGFLHARGHDVLGVDVVPEFVAHASARYPDVRFTEGDLRSLPVDDGSVGAILAWYSLIHLTPAEVPAALAEFARVLVPGGRLLIGFFDGPEEEMFPHGVTPAYFWSIIALEDLLMEAGFTVADFETRRDEGRRPHGSIAAARD